MITTQQKKVLNKLNSLNVRTTWDLYSLEWKGFHALNSCYVRTTAMPTKYAQHAFSVSNSIYGLKILPLNIGNSYVRKFKDFNSICQFILSLFWNKCATGLLRQHFLYERCAIVCPRRLSVLCWWFYLRVRNKVKVETMYINLMRFQSTAPNSFVCPTLHSPHNGIATNRRFECHIMQYTQIHCNHTHKHQYGASTFHSAKSALKCMCGA